MYVDLAHSPLRLLSFQIFTLICDVEAFEGNIISVANKDNSHVIGFRSNVKGSCQVAGNIYTDSILAFSSINNLKHNLNYIKITI